MNIILKEPKNTIKIPLSEVDDVIIVKEHKVGNGSSGRFAKGRYFIPNYGSGDYNHTLVGDLVFLHNREPKITFHNIVDPMNVQNLVNDQKRKLQLTKKVKPIVDFVGVSKMSSQDTEFSLYSHEEFKIDRPSNWIIITNPRPSTEKFVVIFKDPPLDSIDALSVEIEQNTKKISMHELSNLDLMSLEREVPNFRLVETTTFEWVGQLASKIVFDGLVQNRLVRHMRISTIKKSRLYRLAFVCGAEKFHDMLPTVIHMVNSFDFVANTYNNNGTFENNPH